MAEAMKARYLLFPIHQNFHWTILILDIEEGSWKFYNSMRRTGAMPKNPHFNAANEVIHDPSLTNKSSSLSSNALDKKNEKKTERLQLKLSANLHGDQDTHRNSRERQLESKIDRLDLHLEGLAERHGSSVIRDPCRTCVVMIKTKDIVKNVLQFKGSDAKAQDLQAQILDTSKHTKSKLRDFFSKHACLTNFKISNFVQDGSDPYVQESSSVNSSTSFPGPVSVGIIPLQGDFENEETSSCVQEYKIDITRIMRGEDNRTTVMIHNIPKRCTYKMLEDIIGKRYKGGYNKCNKDYAFINLIEPASFIPFYQLASVAMPRSTTPEQRQRPPTKTLFRCGRFEQRVTKIRRRREMKFCPTNLFFLVAVRPKSDLNIENDICGLRAYCNLQFANTRFSEDHIECLDLKCEKEETLYWFFKTLISLCISFPKSKDNFK
ncbi:hypothetical protein ACSBR2_040038 [Camellia fascicularis]